MNKKIIKEIFIFVLLLILIMLILAVALYDLIPSNITVPETISYSSDSTTTSIKQEIAYTNGGDTTADSSQNDSEVVTALKSYSIKASDLKVYSDKAMYIEGNSNPFEYAAEETPATNTVADPNNTTNQTNTNNTTTTANQTANQTTTNTTTPGTLFEKPNSK